MVNSDFERFGKNDFDFKFNLELNSVLWGISVDRILPNIHIDRKNKPEKNMLCCFWTQQVDKHGIFSLGPSITLDLWIEADKILKLFNVRASPFYFDNSLNLSYD